MQFTATKLFTAFLGLIALMQFVSGAALYSEITPEINVQVSGVAKADGCAPTVSGLFSLVFVFCCGFEKFSSSSWTTRLRRRFGDENITNASRIGENMHSTARFVLYFVGFFFACDGKASVCVSLRGFPPKIENVNKGRHFFRQKTLS